MGEHMERNVSSINKKDQIIYLDAKYLSSAPNEKNIKIDHSHLGLKEEIIYGAPSCFIITGYRGVGKTSFVHHLRKEIEDEYKKKEKDDAKGEKILFVSCNFVNGDTKENILRKLIRQLVSSSNENLRNKLRKNTKLDEELTNLYKRTFYSVQDNQLKTTTNTFNFDSSINFVILLFIFLLVPILYIFDSLKGILVSLLSYIKIDPKQYGPYATALVSLISLGCSFLTFKLGKAFTKQKVNQIEIKTLYDEEIAEVRLNEIIEKLTNIGIKVVFILDELDKFEKEEELDKFLGELKPILINGKATFLLITGQNLSNRLEKTSLIDDAFLPSIVQDTYRITLPTDKQFEDLFLRIAQNPVINKNVYEDYLNSLILKSKRIPRKFINILHKEVEWDSTSNPSKPYIVISKEKREIFEIDTKILKCINSVVKVSVDENNAPLLDFLITQLCIYAEKLKSMGAAYFQLEDIHIDEDLKTKFPNYYIDKLNGSIQFLIEEMLNKHILKFDENSASYAFSQVSRGKDTSMLTIKQFLRECTGIEKLLRGIHKEIYSYEESAFFNVVKDLAVLEIITSRTLSNINFMMKLKTQILTSKNLSVYLIDEINSIEMSLNSLRIATVKKYTYYVVKEYLDPKRFAIQYSRRFKLKAGKDFTPPVDDMKTNFVIDIFLRDMKEGSTFNEIFIETSFGSSSVQQVDNVVKKIKQQLKNLSYITPNSKFIFIYFSPSLNNTFKTLIEERIFDIGRSRKISLSIVVASVYRDLDKPLKEYLKDVLQ